MASLYNPAQLDVLRYYLDGYTYGEVAELVSMPVKKVDNTLHTIKTKIKKNRELFE